MRKAIGIILTLFILVAISYMAWRNTQTWDEPAMQTEAAQPEAKVAASTDAGTDVAAVAPAEHHLVVYYFMNDVRCASCKKIETWTHGAIEEAFADELVEGQIVWRMVNTDEAVNHHYVEDYGLVTKQVILVEIDKGEEVQWVNLAEVWNLLGNEEQFKTYIVAETAAQLNWLPQAKL